MKPYCKNHPDREATFFCEKCGFLCTPDEESVGKHPITHISKNNSEFIDLQLKTKILNQSTLLYQCVLKSIQSYAEGQIKANAQQLSELELKSEQIKGNCIKNEMQVINSIIEKDNSFLLQNAAKLINQMGEQLTSIAKTTIEEKLGTEMKNLPKCDSEKTIFIDEKVFNDFCSEHIATEATSKLIKQKQLLMSMRQTKLNTIYVVRNWETKVQLQLQIHCSKRIN